MKKFPLKSILIFLFIGISFSTISCKKGKSLNPTGDSFVQFKLDGVQKKFTVSKILNSHISDGYFDFICSQTSDTAVNSMEIKVFSDSPLDYEDYTYPYNQLFYNDGSSKKYYSFSSNPSTSKFTSITSSRVQGNFSGGITDGAGHTMAVTEGSFDIAL